MRRNRTYRRWWIVVDRSTYRPYDAPPFCTRKHALWWIEDKLTSLGKARAHVIRVERWTNDDSLLPPRINRKDHVAWWWMSVSLPCGVPSIQRVLESELPIDRVLGGEKQIRVVKV